MIILIVIIGVLAFFRRLVSHRKYVEKAENLKNEESGLCKASSRKNLKRRYPPRMLSQQRSQATPASFSWYNPQAGVSVYFANKSAPIVDLWIKMSIANLCTDCFIDEPGKTRDEKDQETYEKRFSYWLLFWGHKKRHKWQTNCHQENVFFYDWSSEPLTHPRSFSFSCTLFHCVYYKIRKTTTKRSDPSGHRNENK